MDPLEYSSPFPTYSSKAFSGKFKSRKLTIKRDRAMMGDGQLQQRVFVFSALCFSAFIVTLIDSSLLRMFKVRMKAFLVNRCFV